MTPAETTTDRADINVAEERRPMTKADLLRALLVERFGHLHPEYRRSRPDPERGDPR